MKVQNIPRILIKIKIYIYITLRNLYALAQ